MAGTVRKRTWTTRKGDVKTAWMVDYYDQNGERHRETFPTQKTAKDRLTDVSAEIKGGVHIPDSRSITVGEAAQLWLKRRKLERVERGSLRTYEQYVRLYITPMIGKKKLANLSAPFVEAFRDELLGRTSRTRAKSVLLALRMVLSDMQRRGFTVQNVALPVRIKDSGRDERPVEAGVDIPHKEEAQRLLQHATGAARARFVTAVFTGLRASELRGLFWSDVDFDRRTLSVRRRADWWGTIGRPKSKNGYRSIPMTPLLTNTLKEWRLACPHPKDGLDLVFPGRGGKVMNHTSLQAAFEELQRSAGIVDADGGPKYGLHALRHFFASWGIEQGFSPKRLQTLMGHGSIKMTYDVYGHLFPQPEDDHARFAAGEAALLGLKPVAG
jgi:integrase